MTSEAARHEIAALMNRLYAMGLTSSKAGNISVRTDDGFCISPSRVDKATLRGEQVVVLDRSWERVGDLNGPPPSSEALFHRSFFDADPQTRCVIHAHPPACTAYASAERTPATRILPSIWRTCGPAAHIPYRRPGTQALGDAVAEAVRAGSRTLILSHHGVAVGGRTVGEAFERLVSLELCAQIEAAAGPLGGAQELADADLALAGIAGRGGGEAGAGGDVEAGIAVDALADGTSSRGAAAGGTAGAADIAPGGTSTGHVDAVSAALVRLVHRAGEQKLFTTAHGAFSARHGDGFLITSRHADRSRLLPTELVQVGLDGRPDPSTPHPLSPSRSAHLHAAIYRAHPEVGAVAVMQSPAVMAYAVSGVTFPSDTLAESYVLLQEVNTLPFGPQYANPDEVAHALGARHPAVMLANDCLITTGATAEEAFGRMEVAEFTARSALAAHAFATNIAMDAATIRELREVYLEG